jgi:hypothetical protein
MLATRDAVIVAASGRPSAGPLRSRTRMACSLAGDLRGPTRTACQEAFDLRSSAVVIWESRGGFNIP